MHRVLRAGLRIGGVVSLLTLAGAARAEHEDALLGFVLGAVVGSALADDDDDDRRYRYVDDDDYRHGHIDARYCRQHRRACARGYRKHAPRYGYLAGYGDVGSDRYRHGHGYGDAHGHYRGHEHRREHRHDRRCRYRDRDDD